MSLQRKRGDKSLFPTPVLEVEPSFYAIEDSVVATSLKTEGQIEGRQSQGRFQCLVVPSPARCKLFRAIQVPDPCRPAQRKPPQCGYAENNGAGFHSLFRRVSVAPRLVSPTSQTCGRAEAGGTGRSWPGR